MSGHRDASPRREGEILESEQQSIHVHFSVERLQFICGNTVFVALAPVVADKSADRFSALVGLPVSMTFVLRSLRLAAAVATTRVSSVAALMPVLAPPVTVHAVQAQLVSGQPVRGKHSGQFKTKSSVKKRFRVKPNGSIVSKHGGKSHLNRSKSSAQLNRLSKTAVLSTHGIRARYLRVMKVSPLLGR